jgi:SAM-dependent methyltransferase
LDRHHDSSDIGNYNYDNTFFRYIEQGAIRSAQIVVPLIIDRLKINSVLDVGCGAGAWLGEYRRLGLPTYVGVDGEYVTNSSLLIPPSSFVPLDITKSFDLQRRFDLVQCLEVGEHIPPAASRTLVENLVRHGDAVLFSAAIPGQGGENHINEQPYEFWRALFAEYGYSGYDFLRPLLRRESSVEVWYRHNAILYVADSSRARLPASVAATVIPENEPIRDVSSVTYKVRTRILARFSVASLTRLAILKHRWLNLVRGVRGLR